MSGQRRFGLLRPLYMSFYSKSLYQDVGQNWRGTCFLYLFIVLAICWIPLTVQYNYIADKLINGPVHSLINEFPSKMTVENGELSISAPVPYNIVDETTGRPVIIFDTSGQHTNLENTAARVLIMKQGVLYYKNDYETRFYQFPQDMSIEVNHEMMKSWLGNLKFILILLVFPICLIGAFIYRIIQALVYGLLGLFFNVFIKSPLDYVPILRLSVIAVTPAILIGTVLELMMVSFPYQYTLYFLLTMGYLIFGLRANKVAAKSESTTEA
ncbi:MAG: hypothetical protein CMF50_03285 [Legionellales bacterium]|nr:hypothetical protein [Legionellales bacterium]|tara:strand:+ start:3265 stop:4071 length:807 start_codon:yes stop_codon:yes gene_type:complete